MSATQRPKELKDFSTPIMNPVATKVKKDKKDRKRSRWSSLPVSQKPFRLLS